MELPNKLLKEHGDTPSLFCFSIFEPSLTPPMRSVAVASTTGNCANVAAPNYTFPGLTSPACGVKSQDTSANITFLLTSGCCDFGSALYSDPAVPCIHYCSSSRSNKSFAHCVSGLIRQPGFNVEQFWCLNNRLTEFKSAAARTAIPPLTEPRPRRQSAALLGVVVALAFCVL